MSATYKVEILLEALGELEAIPTKVRTRIETAIDRLAQNPRPPGAKKLVGEEGYRVRAGDYRVLYAIDDKAQRVTVYRLGHRREVCK